MTNFAYDLPDAPYIARAERFGVEDDEERVIDYCALCGGAVMTDDTYFLNGDAAYHKKCLIQYFRERTEDAMRDFDILPETGVE